MCIAIPVVAGFLIAVAVSAQEPPQKGSGPGKPLSPQESAKAVQAR